jgi:hypothetical protein
MEVQHFVAPSFRENQTPYFERVDIGVAYREGPDFVGLRYGGNGYYDIHSNVSVVKNYGCNVADFEGVKAGDVALILVGSCTYVDKVRLAESLNTSAVILYNPIETPSIPSSRVLDSGWSEGNFLAKRPVIGVTYSLAISLAHYSGPIRLTTNTTIYTPITKNIWCDTEGNEENTIIIGAHLDSVAAGPGINDNGSGSSAILEILKQISAAGFKPVNRIRFAWWGAEEEGLLGSKNYMKTLSPEEHSKVAAGINLDMVGSVNYIPMVGILRSTVYPTAINGSNYITSLFENYLTGIEQPYDYMNLTASSDHWSFIEYGVPAGRITSGAGVIKIEKWRTLAGGMANCPTDPCYHEWCDTTENVSEYAINEFSKAAAKILFQLSSDPNLKTTLSTYTKPLSWNSQTTTLHTEIPSFE